MSHQKQPQVMWKLSNYKANDNGRNTPHSYLNLGGGEPRKTWLASPLWLGISTESEKGPSVEWLNLLPWIPNCGSCLRTTSAEPSLDAILGSTWALALRKCLFWRWLNCHTDLGKWVDLTAPVGGRNTWTSLRHCLGTWSAEMSMTNREAHLVAWKGQFC